MSVKWAIVSSRPMFHDHVEALTIALKRAGQENSGSFQHATKENLFETMTRLQSEDVRAIRFEGDLTESVLEHFPNAPSVLRILKSVDSLIFGKDGREWLKNHLYDAFSRFAARELKTVDLNGAAFVIGKSSEARTIVAALVRTGFNRILVTDADADAGLKFIEELKKSYFNVNFQFTPRSQVMHLAGVCSIAINTLCAADDVSELSELFYFNFLKSGAFWIEVPCAKENSSLIQEARNAGANTHRGIELLVHTDVVWAEASFQVKIDEGAYRKDLETRLALKA